MIAIQIASSAYPSSANSYYFDSKSGLCWRPRCLKASQASTAQTVVQRHGGHGAHLESAPCAMCTPARRRSAPWPPQSRRPGPPSAGAGHTQARHHVNKACAKVEPQHKGHVGPGRRARAASLPNSTLPPSFSVSRPKATASSAMVRRARVPGARGWGCQRTWNTPVKTRPAWVCGTAYRWAPQANGAPQGNTPSSNGKPLIRGFRRRLRFVGS